MLLFVGFLSACLDVVISSDVPMFNQSLSVNQKLVAQFSVVHNELYNHLLSRNESTMIPDMNTIFAPIFVSTRSIISSHEYNKMFALAWNTIAVNSFVYTNSLFDDVAVRTQRVMPRLCYFANSLVDSYSGCSSLSSGNQVFSPQKIPHPRVDSYHRDHFRRPKFAFFWTSNPEMTDIILRVLSPHRLSQPPVHIFADIEGTKLMVDQIARPVTHPSKPPIIVRPFSRLKSSKFLSIRSQTDVCGLASLLLELSNYSFPMFLDGMSVTDAVTTFEGILLSRVAVLNNLLTAVFAPSLYNLDLEDVCASLRSFLRSGRNFANGWNNLPANEKTLHASMLGKSEELLFVGGQAFHYPSYFIQPFWDFLASFPGDPDLSFFSSIFGVLGTGPFSGIFPIRFGSFEYVGIHNSSSFVSIPLATTNIIADGKTYQLNPRVFF